MKSYLLGILEHAVKKTTGDQPVPEIVLERPKHSEHGDIATNIALQLARELKSSPRSIAEDIVSNLDYDPQKISAVEIAGPGFINFRFAPRFLYDELDRIRKLGRKYGRSSTRKGMRINVEFVSANPTGPLTIGHGRNAVLGDTIARLFETTGAQVDREYYFNNAGRQMRILGDSVRARYLQQLGRDQELPEGGYEGNYIIDIANRIHEQYGDSLADETRSPVFQKEAEHYIFEDIQKTLRRMNIEMSSFFNEDQLYQNGAIDQTVKQLREKDLAYDQDQAVWFRTTEFGKDKDTVLVKSSGEPTYRLPDIAYHIDKLNRHYDQCVDIFGADHIDTYPDVLSGVKALGYDPDRIKVLIYQFVTIVKEGKPYKMSTRKANFITLDELMDEVGEDVTRFFFLMRSPDSHLEFDIAEAKEASEKNPVFYLQYAHARINSIYRKFKERYTFKPRCDLSVLSHHTEISLIKRILEYPEAIEKAATHMEPHRLINYLNELAGEFHRFYHDCRILGEDKKLANARMSLLMVVAQVMQNGLSQLGISAPEQM